MHTSNGFYVSPGNSKVRFPIVNLGSGTGCPSAAWCPFSAANFRSSGRRLCYAQKTEKLYPSVLKSRQKNAALIASGDVDADEVASLVDRFFARGSRKGGWQKSYGRIVRINESGDLSAENIRFATALVQSLRKRRIRVYLYSKAPQRLQDAMRQSGAVVLQSERDFVAIPDASLARLPLCHGVCGPCQRCPRGMQSCIIEH